MKRTFLTKRNALISSTDVSWGMFALAFSAFLLLLRLLAPNFFWHLFTPAFRAADALATQSHAFLNHFGDTAQLAARNEMLLKENAVLANENQALLIKVTNLEALLGPSAAGKTAIPGILAGVVARPPESPYDTLLIAEGSRAGIARGQEVFGDGGVPIGVVSSVSADFSRVTLFSSPGTHLSGWVGQTGVPLIITGAGAGAMQASVPRSAGIAAGDTVFVPGPGMLPIGRVTRVIDDPLSPSMTLRITPAFNLFSISLVVVRDTGSAILDAFSYASSTLP